MKDLNRTRLFSYPVLSVTLSTAILFFTCSDFTQKIAKENTELTKAAAAGEIFTGNYLVITEDKVDLIHINVYGDTVHNEVWRGIVLEDHPTSPAPENYRSVIFPGTIIPWFIKNDAPFIRQFAAGMRFPVEGIVDGTNSTLHYYDQSKKSYSDLKLKKGDSYYWIILKDGNYVNVLPESSTQSYTGLLSEKRCHILQKSDHLKIVPEKTRKKLEEVWK